ncbi:MAG: hypothetical protein HC771_04190 [Synechococcales cyanobacterium CRU_2_2]|nr:hypothetical protein [Synechococcales cyanobacterium CRU_2_2]
MSVNTERRGLAETERAVQRLSDELRRVRTVAIFLAKGVMKMQQGRREAIALAPEACKQYMIREFPVLQGPKAETTIEAFANLDDVAANRAENKYLGKAEIRDNEGWIPVTSRYPGAQPYTWSRSVLVLLDTGGLAMSSYFDRQNLEGQWLNLEAGFGTVTHWHELPPVPSEAQQQDVLAALEQTRGLKPQGKGIANRQRAGDRPARPAPVREIYSGAILRDRLRQVPKDVPKAPAGQTPTHPRSSDRLASSVKPLATQPPILPFSGNEKQLPDKKEDIRWI